MAADTEFLFNSVTFKIIESADTPKDGPLSSAVLSEELQSHGAVEHSPPSSNVAKDNLLGITHIISDTIDFKGYDEAINNLISVVTPSWIEVSLLKGRLANPKQHSADPRLFYSGVVVYVADLPEGDKDAIIGGVVAMGGLYSAALSRLVTHIVALNMDPAPCQIAIEKKLDCKIVLPHWFDDCLRLGKRIDEGPYSLPQPRILEPGSQTAVANVPRPDLQSSLMPRNGQLPSPASSPADGRPNLQVFEGRSIFLSHDLNLSVHLRATIESLITMSKGSVTEFVQDCDTLVCQFRETPDYVAGVTEGKEIGNLAWLYHLIIYNTWTSPLKRLLHYPVAAGGLPGFENFRISLSNYNGEARIFLENLAKAAGCEFTKTMKMDNTHLITAHLHSEKCDAAREWNTHIVNHLWLEESYARWEVQSVSNPRYTHFPPRTNLSEVVGQTAIDKAALARHFAKITKRPISTPSGRGTTSATPRSMSTISNVKNGLTTPKTPSVRKLLFDGKENETPSTNGSRSAKDKALSKLHDLAPDIALYEKERKRVGGVTHGGKPQASELAMRDRDSTTPRKRSLSLEAEEDGDSEATPDEDEQPQKKARAMPNIKLLVTGFVRWTEQPKKVVPDKQLLRNLGIAITEDANAATHLAAPKILRTAKFMLAISRGAELLSTSLLEHIISTNATSLPDLSKFTLKDKEGESRLHFKLADAVKRAKANAGQLLSNIPHIYVTEGVHGGYETYRSIIEANGGKCSVYKANTTVKRIPKPTQADPNGMDEDLEESLYLLSGTSAAETKLWGKFKAQASEAGLVGKVAKADWMLDLALSQEIKWGEEYELGE